eukprot:TRINITY_DN3545_c0_g1_i2.p2 TRINITY_DN3545_c0_g1~~TRINITY_DN3545_c0_g1_i2.p2  ORF type:complete len:136 (+),score=15.68 TRINITY_DN3545_c0_g1_i2:113-520(+)
MCIRDSINAEYGETELSAMAASSQSDPTASLRATRGSDAATPTVARSGYGYGYGYGYSYFNPSWSWYNAHLYPRYRYSPYLYRPVVPPLRPFPLVAERQPQVEAEDDEVEETRAAAAGGYRLAVPTFPGPPNHNM